MYHLIFIFVSKVIKLERSRAFQAYKYMGVWELSRKLLIHCITIILSIDIYLDLIHISNIYSYIRKIL